MVHCVWLYLMISKRFFSCRLVYGDVGMTVKEKFSLVARSRSLL